MNVIVNESVVAVAENTSIEQLLKTLDKPLKGSALAVNQNIVRSKIKRYSFGESYQAPFSC